MPVRSIGALALAAALAMPTASLAFDESKYPDLKGQWTRAREPILGGGQAPFDPSTPTKPPADRATGRAASAIPSACRG